MKWNNNAKVNNFVFNNMYNIYNFTCFVRWMLESAAHPPRWWKRYVDGAHTVLVKTPAQELTHSNEEVNIDTRTEKALAFLITWSVIIENGSIKTNETHIMDHTEVDSGKNF